MKKSRNHKKKRLRILYAAIFAVILILGAWYVFSGQQKPGQTTRVFFLKNEKLADVSRDLQNNAAPLTAALNELLKGPNLKERTLGYYTAIPGGTKLLGAKVEKGTAYLDFSPQLEAYGGGAARVQALVAQVVYTATAVRGVRQVKLLIQGKEQEFFGGEGYMIDKPIRREDLPDDQALFL